MRLYEGSYLDQTTRLLGISFLPREGAAVAARSSADRIVDDELMLTAVG